MGHRNYHSSKSVSTLQDSSLPTESYIDKYQRYICHERIKAKKILETKPVLLMVKWMGLFFGYLHTENNILLYELPVNFEC